MIAIEQLRFARGAQVVLRDIDLRVARSEVVSVMGPSGCGKTTLLKCLAGLERPQAGRILLDFEGDDEGAIDLAALSEEKLIEIRRFIGMVFQYAALFDSLTVRDNVAFPMHRFRPELTESEVDEEVDRLLELVGLQAGQDRSKLPAQLSGGMRKRVGLARALALQPQVILYDEPSSGLDPVSAAQIDRLILEMRDKVGVTSVVVSHHVPNIMRTSDRVAMLLAGEVLAVGTPAELQQSDDPRVQQFIQGTADGPLTDGG
ncbi:MAG: ATP-binding cassette domain-containing protein [Fimbriimonadaceae bacterium]|nr:ATP-binding cassette domain-containing protein [Fimbriimonadaceae bacterium]